MTSAKIDIGAVLSKVFGVYGQTAGKIIPIAVCLFLPVTLLTAAAEDSVAGSILANALSVVASLWFAGVVVKAVQDAYEDGVVDASVGELFRAVAPRLLTLFLVGLVAGIAIFVGFLLLIVPGLILITIWAVAAPVVVLEGKGVFEALGRSRELVRGNGWQVFGVLVALLAIVLVASIVIGSIGAIGDSFVVLVIVSLLLFALLSPLQALAQAVLYFALREAHGQPALSAPTGALAGGFAPPVPPEPAAPAPPAAPEAPQPPAPGGTDAFGNPVQPPSSPPPPPQTP